MPFHSLYTLTAVLIKCKNYVVCCLFHNLIIQSKCHPYKYYNYVTRVKLKSLINEK